MPTARSFALVAVALLIGCSEGNLVGTGGVPDAGVMGGGGVGGSRLGAAGFGGGAGGFAVIGGRSGTGNDGNVAGVGGDGQTGGAGQTAGAGGGVVDTCLPVSDLRCAPSLCGNGVLDTCLVRSGLGGCPEVAVQEACEAAEMGGQTCESAGFGSGKVKCSPFCEADTTMCEECKPLTSSLLRCGDLPTAGIYVRQAALAGTDTEVGLAWVDIDGNGNVGSLSFARLSPSLDVLSQTSADEPRKPWLSSVDVAPLPSGWVVAVAVDPDVVIHRFDPSGQPGARTVVETAPAGVLVPPILAPRPGGGPLMVWQTDAGVRAAVIAADGSSTTRPVTVAAGEELRSAFSATFVAGSFYVGMQVNDGSDRGQLRVVRLGTDGQPAETFQALAGVTVVDPVLVSGGDDLRVLYHTLEGWTANLEEIWELELAGIGPTGAAIAPQLEIPHEPDAFLNAIGLGFGSDTGLVLVGFSDMVSVSVARVRRDGGFATAPVKITGNASENYFSARLATRRGPDAVVLWFSPSTGRFRIARAVL